LILFIKKFKIKLKFAAFLILFEDLWIVYTLYTAKIKIKMTLFLI